MLQEAALSRFKDWYDGEKRGKGSVPKGTVAGALVVPDRLKHSYDLSLARHLTSGGAQIKNASGENIKRILGKFGETRHFVAEGGRTNRGLPQAIDEMLKALAALKLEQCSEGERNAILEELQAFLVEKVKEFHSKERLKIAYDPSMSTWQFIADLLEAARIDDKGGPVAQHLVGAKLQLRFPDEPIGRESYSTADKQLGRPGDFTLGTTAFHVTMAPMPAVYDKCERNISDGLRPYLLVPNNRLVGVRQNIEVLSLGKGRITAESIESFVSHNINELSGFSGDKLAQELCNLLEKYNSRIDEIEADKSLMVEIPQNLLRRSSKDS